jgi:sigma-54 dependent transcriptional regulator, acetoin dehydrogenase operon transcriptional activator AcoR
MQHATPDQLRQARQCLLETGQVPQGLLDPALIESWQRSRQAGLSPTEPPHAVQSSSIEWRKALVREFNLMAQARPVMEFVSQQMTGSASMLLLADAQGMVLHSLGDAVFMERVERIALQTGAIWREDQRGTNAIGTALAQSKPIVIQGHAHYLDRHGFMTSLASPLLASDGQVRGVLGLVCDHMAYQAHAFALLKSATRLVEDRLFHDKHLNDPMLRFHPRKEGLGAIGEALVALAEEGWVIGANTIAQQWLGLSSQQIGSITLDKLLGPQAQRLLTLQNTGQAAKVTTMQGQILYVRDEPDHRRRVWATQPLPSGTPRLGGSTATAIPPRPIREVRHDTRMTQALGRALRVQAQGIAVLLQGEAGTGKERFARALHDQGTRAQQPFVVVNCGAMDAHLLEAQLFGYVGHAFNGGRAQDTPGLIEQAHQGTLYLDAIAELPLPLQTRLLQCLESKAVRPMGGCHDQPVDFALVCAGHQVLRDAVTNGQFREDLFWRINGLTVQLPPLRERGDLVELIDDLLHDLGRDMKRQHAPSLADEVLQALQQHPWPGNLRQLNKVFKTACALLSPHEDELHWEHFGEDVWDDVFSRPYRMDEAEQSQAVSFTGPSPLETPEDTNLKRLSVSAIDKAIKASQGNMSQAAKRLGISRNTLYRRMKQT